MSSIHDYDTVNLIDEENVIRIIDQTKLPGSIEICSRHRRSGMRSIC